MHDRLQLLYIVQAGDLIKIGVSLNVDTLFGRLRGIQNTGGRRVQLLSLSRGYRSEEQSLHKEFGAQRTYGEWFRITPELEQRAADLHQMKAVALYTQKLLDAPEGRAAGREKKPCIPWKFRGKPPKTRLLAEAVQ